jgi:elongation factor G
VIIRGQVPLAELAGYQSRLNAMTAGQGRYSLALSHYDPVPPAVQAQLTSQYKVKEEE